MIAGACGKAFTLVVTSSGEVYGFGNGKSGQLGKNEREIRKWPVRVDALFGKPITAVACGEEFSMALSANGILYSFGANQSGMRLELA